MRDKGWWLVLGASMLLFALSRTQKGQAVVSEVADSVGSAVRGYRNNNPLNIEWGDDWQGLLAPADRTDSRFCEFISMPYGIRAAAIILRNYQRLYNIRTVRAVVSRWDQDPGDPIDKYIDKVCAYMGVTADTVLNFQDRATVFAYLRGAMTQEIGSVAAALVSDADVNAGLDLAGFA